MSEERFTLNTDDKGVILIPNSILRDGKEMSEREVVDCLNEQQDTIGEQKIAIDELITDYKKLEKENEQLRQMIKENVFERYREGSLADLEFKAIAYDDIVKLEMSYESGPKVIVICRQGKKENVKSFCQMFIPFGVYYEIKELENER